MSDTQKLLPCPHCGGDAGLSRTNFYVPLHAVKCPHCQHAHATRDAAIEAWNRRATPPGDNTLTDPIAVHVGMLRGDIAMPALTNFLHAIGNGTLEAFRDVVEIAARNEESESVKVARAALSHGEDDNGK